MNFGLIITILAACKSAARLGFHGSVYQYGNFGYLSPKEITHIKKILKIKYVQKYGPRFCWPTISNLGLKHGLETYVQAGHKNLKVSTKFPIQFKKIIFKWIYNDVWIKLFYVLNSARILEYHSSMQQRQQSLRVKLLKKRVKKTLIHPIVWSERMEI